MDLVEPIPPELEGHLRRKLRPGELLMVLLSSDISQQGRFDSSWLAMTDERLMVLRSNGAGMEELEEVPLADIEKVRTRSYVGNGTLVVDLPGESREIVRFSQGAFYKFSAVPQVVEAALVHPAAEETPGEDASPIRRVEYCRTCGRALRSGSAVCPNCIRKTETFWRLLSYIRPYKRIAAAGFLLTVTVTAISLLPPLLNEKLIDDVLTPVIIEYTSLEKSGASARGLESPRRSGDAAGLDRPRPAGNPPRPHPAQQPAQLQPRLARAARGVRPADGDLRVPAVPVAELLQPHEHRPGDEPRHRGHRPHAPVRHARLSGHGDLRPHGRRDRRRAALQELAAGPAGTGADLDDRRGDGLLHPARALGLPHDLAPRRHAQRPPRRHHPRRQGGQGVRPGGPGAQALRPAQRPARRSAHGVGEDALPFPARHRLLHLGWIGGSLVVRRPSRPQRDADPRRAAGVHHLHDDVLQTGGGAVHALRRPRVGRHLGGTGVRDPRHRTGCRRRPRRRRPRGHRRPRRVPRRQLHLRRFRAHPRPRLLHGRARGDDRHRRTERGRQVDAGQPRLAVLRRHRRGGPDRRHPGRGDEAAAAARPGRRGAAGAAAVPGHHRREHRLRQPASASRRR